MNLPRALLPVVAMVVLLASPPGTVEAQESATPVPTWSPGEQLPSIYEAIVVRDSFGLRADPEYVAQSLGDPETFPYMWENLPLTSAEQADMVARLEVQRQVTSFIPSGQPGFLEAYLDQRRGGIPVFLFDRPVDEVRDRIARLLPGIEFEIHQVDTTLRELSRVRTDIRRSSKALAEEGIEVTAVAIDAANERVEVGVVAATDVARERLAEFGDAIVVVERPSLVEIKLPPSPFRSLWKPLDTDDLGLRYYCDATPFTASELATATPADHAEPPLRGAIEDHGRILSDDDGDWYVVKRGDGRVLALAVDGRGVESMELERAKSEQYFSDAWNFVRGGDCEPVAAFGRGLGGEWRLDPRYPAPGPDTRKLHVIGNAGCNGTERRGKARITYTKTAALIAIPMGDKIHSDMCHGLGPARMTITLPKPLGSRALYDVGSLPIRRVALPT